MSLRHMTLVWTHAPSLLKPGPLVVLLAMADSANDDTGCCWLSVASLAKKSGLCERQVQRIHDDLVADGWLDDLGPHPDPRYRKTTVYRIVVRQPGGTPATPEPAPTADAAAADKMSPVAIRANVTGDIGRAPTPPTGDNRRTAPPPNVTQSHREPSDQSGERARAQRDPPPPDGDDLDDEPRPPDPEARRAGNRRRFVRVLRELVVASEREVEVDEWVGVGRQACAHGFAELVEAVTWCVVTGRAEGLRVRWAGDVVNLATRCRAWLRAQRDRTPHQAAIHDAQPADAGEE